MKNRSVGARSNPKPLARRRSKRKARPAPSPLGEGVLPPVLFPGTNSTERRRLARLKAMGRIRAVGPRLYVSVPEAETARTLRQTWPAIVDRLFPNALITHRTALEFRPSPD